MNGDSLHRNTYRLSKVNSIQYCFTKLAFTARYIKNLHDMRKMLETYALRFLTPLLSAVSCQRPGISTISGLRKSAGPHLPSSEAGDMADRAVDRRHIRAPVGNAQPHPPNWAGNWGYDRERELVQQIGPIEHNSSGKAERGIAPPQRGDRSAKQQQRRRDLAEREKQRRMDLANAFDELAAMLSKIEPNEEEEEEEEEIVNGNKRRKKGSFSETEADTLGMNRLDLIGRTIDTLRRLHEENTDLKERPMPGKGEEEVSRTRTMRMGSLVYLFLFNSPIVATNRRYSSWYQLMRMVRHGAG